MAEIRHLLSHTIFAFRRSLAHVLAWSTWRRHHQAVAKFYHYKRRGAFLTHLQL